MAGQGGDRHGVKAGVLAGRSADVGVGVDPQDRQVVPVPEREGGEWGDADGTFTAKSGDARRIVLLDYLQSARQLLDKDLLGLDTIDPLEPLVTHRDGDDCRGAVAGRQDRLEDRRADGITATRHVVWELRRERPHAGGASALPLRTQQPERPTVTARGADRAGLGVGHRSPPPAG